MWLIFIISLAIFSHLGSGAAITKDSSFWLEDSCQNSSDKNITKSFNEAKTFCNMEKVGDSESEQKLCEKLKVNFKDLCESGKKGSAQSIPPVLCVLVI